MCQTEHLYHTPFSQGSGIIVEEEVERIYGSEAQVTACEQALSLEHKAAAHTSSRQLGQHEPDLCIAKADQIPAQRRELGMKSYLVEELWANGSCWMTSRSSLTVRLWLS